MFRAIKQKLQERKRALVGRNNTEYKAVEIIARYIDAGDVTVAYDDTKGLLRIQTHSKAMASDLLFRLEALSVELKRGGVSVRSIVVH